MQLQAYQHRLARLIKHPADLTNVVAFDHDDYLTTAPTSSELARVRQVARFWRRVQLSSFCPLTCRTLHQLDRLDTDVADFCAETDVSAYVEQAGRAFLTFVADRYEGLVRSIAQFEQAELDVRSGTRHYVAIPWPANPALVLKYLLHQEAVDLRAARGAYQTVHRSGAPFLIKNS